MYISVALNGPKERNLTFMRGDEMTVNLIVYALDGDTVPLVVTNLQASTGDKGFFPVGSEFTVPCGLGRTRYEIVGDIAAVRTTLVYGYIEAPFDCNVCWSCCNECIFPCTIPTTQAANVVVSDAGQYYVGQNAEDVLQEVAVNIRALGGGNAQTIGFINQPAKYTWATKPLASSFDGLVIRITDVGSGQLGNGGGTLWFSNGTKWKAVNGSAVLDSIDTPNASSGNALQNLNPNHNAIYGGVLGLYDCFDVELTATKSGTTATATITLRYGPLGTIADPVISTISDLASTSQGGGYKFSFKRISATQIQRLGGAAGSNPFGGASLGLPPAAVTVSNMDTVTHYLSICCQLNSGTEVVTITDYTMTLASTDS